jgi:hypothetical protein
MQLTADGEEIYRKFSYGSNSRRLSIIKDETLQRLRMLDGFYDRYDVADEVLGATVIPWAIGAAATGAFLYAVWEAGFMLAIKGGLVRNDHENHGDRAVMAFLASVALAALTVVIFAKSLISLVTRTLVTLTDGYSTPNQSRFMVEGPLDTAADFVENLFDKSDDNDAPVMGGVFSHFANS